MLNSYLIDDPRAVNRTYPGCSYSRRTITIKLIIKLISRMRCKDLCRTNDTNRPQKNMRKERNIKNANIPRQNKTSAELKSTRNKPETERGHIFVFLNSSFFHGRQGERGERSQTDHPSRSKICWQMKNMPAFLL